MQSAAKMIVLLGLLFLFFTHIASVPILKQVQVVTRHGAQNLLTKTATTLQEASSTLTPNGQKHLYKLGVWLQTTYTGLGGIDIYNSMLCGSHISCCQTCIVTSELKSALMKYFGVQNACLHVQCNMLCSAK